MEEQKTFSGFSRNLWDQWFENVSANIEESLRPSTEDIKKTFRILGFIITDEEATYVREHWNDDSSSIRN